MAERASPKEFCQFLCLEGELQLPPASQRTSLISAGRSEQVPFKLLLLVWVLEFLFPTALSVSQALSLAFEVKHSQNSPSLHRKPESGPSTGTPTPQLLAEIICKCKHSHGCGLLTQSISIDCTVTLPHLPVSLQFLLHVFSYRRYFLIGLSPFHCWLFYTML